MYLISKCPKCLNQSVEPDFERTLEKYQQKYIDDVRTVLPYEKAPIKFEYMSLSCNTQGCNFKDEVSLEEVVKGVSDNWSDIAWATVKRQYGAPENYDAYLKKYVFEKGLHKKVSEEDRKNNPFIDRLIRNAEKEYTKNSAN